MITLQPSARYRNGGTSTKILPEFSFPTTKGDSRISYETGRFSTFPELARTAPTSSNKPFIPDFQQTLSCNLSSLDSRELAAILTVTTFEK